MADEFLLILHCLPQIGVKGSLCDIPIDVYLLVAVSLTNDASTALLQITGTPGTIQVVQGNQSILDVHTGTHFEGAAHQNTHLPSTHFGKKFLFAGFGVGFVNKRNLFLRDAARNQFSANVIVDRKGGIGGIERGKRIGTLCAREVTLFRQSFSDRSLGFRCRNITKN